MKTLITTSTLIITVATHGMAGGLAEPIPEPAPWPAFTWSGIYGGVQYSRTETQKHTKVEEYETVKCGVKNCDVEVPDGLIGNEEINSLPDKVYGLPRHDPNHNCGRMTYDCATQRDDNGDVTEVWLTGPLTVTSAEYTLTETSTSEGFGVFAGGRYDTGSIVLGAEVSLSEDLNVASVHAGYDAGYTLPYIGLGATSYEGSVDPVAVVGVDRMIWGNVFAGGVLNAGKDVKSATFRIAIKF